MWGKKVIFYMYNFNFPHLMPLNWNKLEYPFFNVFKWNKCFTNLQIKEFWNTKLCIEVNEPWSTKPFFSLYP